MKGEGRNGCLQEALTLLGTLYLIPLGVAAAAVLILVLLAFMRSC